MPSLLIGVAILCLVLGGVAVPGGDPSATSPPSPNAASQTAPHLPATLGAAVRPFASTTTAAGGLSWTEAPGPTVSAQGWGFDYLRAAYDAAAGYLVAYGPTDHGPNDSWDITDCEDSTWAFEGGRWTNLLVSGPTPTRCASMVGYDPGDGSVVLYGGWYGANYTHLHDTWTFSDGAWTEANSLVSPNISGTFVSDPALGCALFFGGPTWEFCHGQWSELLASGPPYDPSLAPSLTYDGSTGCVLLLTQMPLTEWENETWEYCGGASWTQLLIPPPAIVGDGTLAWDPELQGDVLFGGAVASPSGPTPVVFTNETWLFRAGAWSQLNLTGPSPRDYPVVAFDPTIGRLIMTSGWLGTGDTGTRWGNDTWYLGFPPEDLRLSATDSPSAICSQLNPGCQAFATESRITLTVTVGLANATNETGLATMGSAAVYGPYEWVDLPSLTYIPRGSIALAPAPDATETCSAVTYVDSPPCTTNATPGTIAGQATLTWAWGTNASQPALGIGDVWSVSFLVVATGPPFTTVPVDACVTAGCLAAGSGSVGGRSSDLQFTPFGNRTFDNDSVPLVTLQVVVEATPTPPPSSAPPAGPPGVGAPLPAPVSPTPVATPVMVPPTALTATTPTASISLLSVAAGILSAGVTGTLIRARPTRMKVGIRASSGRGSRRETRAPANRGSD